MDDITHTLAASLIARANPSKKKGLALACLAGALLPDIDIVLTLKSRHLYLTEHRGFTHSLVGAVPMALLAVFIAWLFVRKKPDRAAFPALFGMALAGWASHVLLDVCTSWGTMLLWPDRTRFALDQLFIIDLWYAGIMAVALVFSAFYHRKRSVVAAVGILCVIGYHALAAYEHHRAVETMRRETPGAWVAAFPEPVSPFRWSGFSKKDSMIRNSRLDFLQDEKPYYRNAWKEPDPSAEYLRALEQPNIKTFLWFARVPIWEVDQEKLGTTVVRFRDERFRVSTAHHRLTMPHRFTADVVFEGGKIIDSTY